MTLPDVPGDQMPALSRPRRHWLDLLGTQAVVLLLLVVALLELDALCTRVWLPVVITATQQRATLQVGSEIIPLGPIGQPAALDFAAHNPLVHEYQIDGTDSTNNFTLDPTYLASIATSPYYRFQDWTRNLDGTSAWQDLTITTDGRPAGTIAQPGGGAEGQTVPLPTAAHTLTMRLYLQRPETPMTVSLVLAGNSALQITLDRNDRKIILTPSGSRASTLPMSATFFPDDPAPFGAMVADFLVRTLLWACLVALVVLALDALAAALWARLAGARGVAGFTALAAGWPTYVRLREVVDRLADPASRLAVFARERTARVPRTPWAIVWRTRVRLADGWARLASAIHPLGLLALALSFAYTVWIALVEYRALPHIYDAVAYLFGAKMYSSGQLSVPLPPAVDRFPGPFMVQHAGQWFTQYPPGTSAMLALGLRLGVPWLVVPVMGTLALLAIGLTAARLYDRRVATLALLLGVLSPFYSYLAASYLSHAVALCFLAWGLWALVRFAQGGVGWNLPLAALLFGMGALTRDLVAVLYAAIVVPGVVLTYWPSVRQNWHRWLVPGLGFLLTGLLCFGVYMAVDAILTGNPRVTPRSLIFPGDRWGFGQGIGFYGKHTLAAGFVTEDELLASLAIDLFGWPFYLTLSFLALPFLLWRTKRADWLLLAGAMIMLGAYIGYYYHGIYLGPRYLFETLPFLLPLTARGILTLAAAGRVAGQALGRWLRRARLALGATEDLWPALPFSLGTAALVAGLIACNLLYFTPRQIALHQNFTGFPAGSQVDTAALGHPPFHHAIVVTGNYDLYGFTLFALNDPGLRGDVLYAYAGTPGEYQELRHAFPGRAIYQILTAADGAVTYQKISS